MGLFILKGLYISAQSQLILLFSSKGSLITIKQLLFPEDKPPYEMLYQGVTNMRLKCILLSEEWKTAFILSLNSLSLPV